MKSDAIGVVEAAYSLEGNDAAWLRGAVTTLTSSFGEGLGGYGALIDMSDFDNPDITAPIVIDSPVPIESVIAVNTRAPAKDLAQVYGRLTVGTSSSISGLEWSRTGYLMPYGVADVTGICALDARRFGCVLGIFLPQARRLSSREVSRYCRTAAHLATGLRLRRALRGASLEDINPIEGADAVLAADGTVLHAEQPAVSSREVLRHHARSIDKARASMRRSDPDGALETWTAMVEGRWTLIDHFESDGRRLVIARRNDSKVAWPDALSPMERSVASLAALGHPNKIIAYELGLPTSTVSTHLADAIAKLGLSSRSELAAAFGALVRLVESEEAG